ncbi:MAG: YbhB/YbcL family Raf kinase inhibitor-like protein [Chromatiales bacterium]|nr:YbhB/YbcL family Raf kinase inhibitor-like protein [Chromatiales bacterium]
MGFALSDLKLVSNAFSDGAAIPRRHTGEADDISPALAWSNAPEGIRSWALVCHDPDAPLVGSDGGYGFVHWVLYNLPAHCRSLEEGTREGTAGKNDFGKQGYGGPMPPPGHGTHRYYFWLLALDSDRELPAGLTLRELLTGIEPAVKAMNRLVGTYRRDKS